MLFVNLNILLFIALISFYILSNYKILNFLIFIICNILIGLYCFNNFQSFTIIVPDQFSNIFSDALSTYLILLTAIISLSCLIWILKSKSWKELIIVIFITEICLLQIFVTKNLLIFYIFFEISALPLLFLIIAKGPTFRRSIAFNYFF